jgi:hypothetical protein
MHMMKLKYAIGAVLVMGLGCAPVDDDGDFDEVELEELTAEHQQALLGISPECNPDDLQGFQKFLCKIKRRLEGRRLFDKEEFAGNGRTCLTCHSKKNGTLTLAQIQQRKSVPGHPLFQHDALDDDGVGTSRFEAEGTIRVTLPLPPYVKLMNDPTATTIDVFRGIPTTENTPALDPVLMQDGRNADLQEQALGAINAHAQNTVVPTENQLDLIAEFQQRSHRFFSNSTLRKWAKGTGPAPELPQGNTASEQRGRLFFVDAPFAPPSKVGVCGMCHSGPMLNEANEFGAQVFPADEGARFHPVGVSERNGNNHPVHALLVDDGFGNWVPVFTPDPGMMLQPQLLPPPFVVPPFVFANFFKTPQLWGVSKTAPYFHDNSSRTLEDVVDQYQFMFDTDPFVSWANIQFTQQDKEDMVDFMKLL